MIASLRVEPLRPWLEPAWDGFVAAHPGGWFWHTTGWIKYQQAYSHRNADHSFAVLDERHRVVAVAPLMAHAPAGAPVELSYSGDPLPRPLADDPAAVQLVAARVAQVARDSGAHQVVIAGHPFRGSGRIGDGPRVARAAQWVIDLAGESVSWEAVRKSYRALIHRGQRQFTFTGSFGTGDPDPIFAKYQVLHCGLAAMPRADETYRLQRQWFGAGNALIFVAEDHVATYGAAYWFVYKDCAYYGSAAYRVHNVAHALVWRSLVALRARGVRWVSMGWQGTARDEKQRNIEFFKRGFGGSAVPVDVVREPQP